MNWKSLGLFATPLINIQLENAEKAKAFFYEKIHKNTGNHKLVHFHSAQNVFDIYPELSWLKRDIENAANFAYQELLNYKHSGPMQITSAWFNLCDVGGNQIKHSHANNLLSGTFYLNADENSELEFYHPLSGDSLHPELYDEPAQSANNFGLKYHFREVNVAVKTGDCLFWPSQLRHGYKNNKTPQRLTLSFNLMPEKLNTTYQSESSN